MGRPPVCIAFMLIGTIFILGQTSCNNRKKKAKKDKPADITIPHSNSVKNNLLFVKGDSLQISVDDHFITVPKNLVNNYDSVYNGIYRIKNNSTHPISSIHLNDIVYFTTYESVGTGYRGYLYAFDLKRKKLLTSDSNKQDYVFSSAGIFFIYKQYIFSVCKPGFENTEAKFTTNVEIHKIDNNKFHYIKHIKSTGEMTDSDTSIIKLYNQVTKY